MFGELILKIQSEHFKFKGWVQKYGYSGEMLQFFRLINEGDFNAINGNYLNPIISELMAQQPKKLTIDVKSM